MTKNTEVKTSKVAPVQVPAKPAKLVDTKAPATVAKAPETKAPEEKAKRQTTATREACKEARKELDARAGIKSTGKPIAARAGSLRYNILKAIMESKTGVEACQKEVNGPGKHETTPYRIKMVDVGFAIGNGYITVVAK